MNGHSDAVDQANQEYAEQQEQAAIDLQEYYGCIKRDIRNEQIESTANQS